MNILKETVSQKDLSKQNIFAALIVLLICIVYLFPAFLGKVDTPFDIRDTRMYPWSYYAVEKKSKMDTIWQEEISLVIFCFNERNVIERTIDEIMV